MRVLVVIDSLSPGGAEASLAALAPHLVARGVELGVAHFSDRPGLQDQLASAGAELLPIDGERRSHRLRGARRAIGEFGPDLVHTTLFEADVLGRIAAQLARVPAVTSLVNEGHQRGREPAVSRWKLEGARVVDAATARLARRFHAVTHSVADTMARRLHIPRSRIDVIHRGRDPESLGRRDGARTAAVRGRLEVAGPLLVAAGRQEHQKGFDLLLRAFRRVVDELPEATLLIAGRTGRASDALTAEHHRLGLGDRVRLLGPREDVFDLIAVADAFVLPSRWEGTAGVLLEAMALEAPIVASDLAGVREVVGTHARLVPPEDERALGDALAAVLREGPEPGSVDAARRRFLEAFTIERSADGMLAFYERALRRPASSS